MNTSYIKLLQLIKQFADNHLQVKRFSADFDEQVDSYGNTSEAYPILYVAPQGNALGMNTNTFTVTVYCFDLIQEGRQNINYIISDTDLILNDLYIYLRDGNYQHLDVLSEPTVTPLNNFLLDYAAGNQMTLTVEVESYGLCEIPIEPIPPVDDCEALLHSLTSEQLNECILPSYNFANPAVFGNLTQQQLDDLTDELCGGGQPIDIYINGVLVVSQTTVDTYLDVVNTANTPVGSWNGSEWVAPDGAVANSNSSYTNTIPSGGNLVLPDITVTDSDGSTFTQPAQENVTCTPIPPCADATVNVNSTLFDTVASGGTLNISVRQQTGSTEIGSKQGQHWRVNNSAITVNSASLVSLPATDAHNLDIKYENGTPVGTIVSPTLVEIPDPITPSGIAYQRIDKNVEASSFINGDEWFYELAGKIVDVATPTYPVYVQEMDFAAADPFLTLKHNNIFGNKNRFTVHPTNADIIYDHLYAVTWWKGYGNLTMNMANSLIFVSGGTVVDGITFRPCTEREMKSIMNQQIVSEPLNWSPLNYSNSTTGVLTCSWQNNSNKGNTSGANVGQFRRLTGVAVGGAPYGDTGTIAANATTTHQFIMINREGVFNPL
jgi:hypothetical protein